MKACRRLRKKGVSRAPESAGGDHVIDIDRKPKIQRVPLMHREVEANRKCYDPLVVSIGPFHHGKSLEITEEYKSTMAHQYTNHNRELYDRLYNNVKAIAGDARNCFSLGSAESFGEDAFAKMMFLDGCFILQFIRCFVDQECKGKDFKMKLFLQALVRRDLLLIENQLPFQVLIVLMKNEQDDEDKWKDTFRRFLDEIFKGEEINFDRYAHFLDMIHTLFIDKSALSTRPTLSIGESYRSAKELKAVGIHFRKSDSHQLTDVQFKTIFLKGYLKLPQITIDDSTKSMLLNMVAYEACPDAPDDLGVSSYICFMDSLIDHAEDVKELRTKGILLNRLGSDQQVADLFNQIADNLVSNTCVFAKVKEKLESHYKSNIKIWFAEWLHTHFTSPWTVLALIGAIFALVLSVIQTYEAMHATETSPPPPCPCMAANHTI